MTEVVKPAVRPARPFFSSGPCAKRPGWTPEALKDALVGRSHRSKPGKAKLKDAIVRTKKLLGIPDNYRVGIVPASDTGAVEMAMWSMLGPLEVDIFAWESFGEDWVTDTVKQLKLKAHVHKAPYGELPEMKTAKNRDVVFLWNGTTSGVKVPNADWIPADREICPGTSSMSPPSPGRRFWAAKLRTASWFCRRTPWHAWKAIRHTGRCPRSSA
jgi:phosphoserine aminotransferase